MTFLALFCSFAQLIYLAVFVSPTADAELNLQKGNFLTEIATTRINMQVYVLYFCKMLMKNTTDREFKVHMKGNYLIIKVQK